MPGLSIVAPGLPPTTRQLGHERLEGCVVRGNRQAGVGAKLTHAQCQRSVQTGGQGLPSLGQGLRQNENRVDAAHLGVKWNRLRPVGGQFHQRLATRSRAGEPGGLDRRMLHQRPISRPGPYSSEKVPSGRPHSFTAALTAWPTSSAVPG